MSLQGETHLSVLLSCVGLLFSSVFFLCITLIVCNPNLRYTMPGSITSVKAFSVGNTDALSKAIASCSNLAELLELVPATFRPRMQDLLNRLYRAGIKSNHARTYLATLEKHLVSGTFPPEIGGRVHAPAIQISKEYNATAEWANQRGLLEEVTSSHKKSLLSTAISIKKSEVAYLQGQLAEPRYEGDAEAIFEEVSKTLVADANVPQLTDGSYDPEKIPIWVKTDISQMRQVRLPLCGRAIALAYTQVQQETVKKMRALTVKAQVDQDVEMKDAPSKSDTVDTLVDRKFQQLLKEYKLSNKGKHTYPSLGRPASLIDFPRPGKSKKVFPEQASQSQPSITSSCEQETKRKGKRKGEWEKEVFREVAQVERAFSGLSCVRLRAASSRVLPLVSELRRRDRVVTSTNEAIAFLEEFPDLFCNVSAEARQLFVSRHTPIGILDFSHSAEEGIFKGPGVIVPAYVQFKLALNTKFILHKDPDTRKVFEAWSALERSVRLRWHFRDSPRSAPTKFYVPKSNWEPPPRDRDPIIERGLREGKDFLLSQAAALNLPAAHKSNPDLRSIHNFLHENHLLVKITDKNLGLSIMSKDWYNQQCELLLSDESTYDLITQDVLTYYRTEAYNRIEAIVRGSSFSPQTSEYLLASKEDGQLPEFHGIPKVHKIPWRMRPIIPSHSWITRRSSEVCDFALREYVKSMFPWVMESTKEVISCLQRKTIIRSEEIWLVTGDVEAFYTNVNLPSTIDSVRKSAYGNPVLDGADKTTIASLLEVVMHANCFGFNGKLFYQINGTAMGTACAPSFANFHLGIKEQALHDIISSLTNDKDGLIFYGRYIDDILLVFKGPRTALQSCLDRLSTGLQPFTIGWEISSVYTPKSFLDAEFFFEQGFGPLGLQSRVYRKKLNKHQYIPWSSAHPLSVKKAFVKAELTRYMIISSNKTLFEEKTSEFMESLRRRGYPSSILSSWRFQVKYEDRQAALSKRKAIGERGLPLMLPSSYNEVWEYLDVRSAFETMWKTWTSNPEPLPASLRGPLIKSLRRTENLFDKFSAWNKAVLRSLPGSDGVLPLR